VLIEYYLSRNIGFKHRKKLVDYLYSLLNPFLEEKIQGFLEAQKLERTLSYVSFKHRKKLVDYLYSLPKSFFRGEDTRFSRSAKT